MHRTLLIPLATALTLSLPATADAVDPALAEGAPTCHGKPATIVGAPGAFEVNGTDGDDVIVATDNTIVLGLDGDDTICVSGQVTPGEGVLAGDGDDLVDATAVVSRRFFAGLGNGDDIFIGSPGRDEVYGGQSLRQDVGRDTIRTGSGDDIVESGTNALPNLDQVDLGGDADVLSWRGAPGGTAMVRGGEGKRDTLELSGGGGAVGDTWVADNRRRQGRIDGELAVSWTGFESFGFDVGTRRGVTFLGGSRNERVTSWRPVTALTGAGNDVITVYGAHARRLLGGSGRDTVELLWPTRPDNALLVVDLMARRGTLGGGREFQISAENLVLEGRRVRVSGDADPNRIEVRKAEQAHLSGGAGDDRLRGGGGTDTLLGGGGRDTADGAGDRDRCVAEVRERCER